MIEKIKKHTVIIKNFFLKKDLYPYHLTNPQKTFLCLGIPLLVSLCIKIVLLAALFKGSINNDGTLYITAAKHYAAGEFAKGLSLYPMPAYPLLLVLVHFLVPDWIFSGYIISITSMVLATIPLYYLTKTLFGIRPAFWACLIFATLPKINDWSLFISRDAPFLFIFGLCVYFSLRSVKETDVYLFVITFFLAWISILIRMEAVLFIFFYFCALICFAVMRKELRSHFALRSLLWSGIPFCIVVIAFFAIGTKVMAVNRFDQLAYEVSKILNGEFLVKYDQIYNFLAEAENHPPFSRFTSNFAALARHYLLIIYSIYLFATIGEILFPLSCIPLFVGLKNKVTLFGLFILCLGFGFVLPAFYSFLTRDFITTRFLLIPAFLLLPWVGLGLDTLIMKIKKRPNKKIFIVFISVLIIAPTLKTMNSTFYKDNIPLVAKWLTENNMSDNAKIVTNIKETSFYIDLELREGREWKTIFYKQKKHRVGIEEFALKQKADTIIFKIKNKEMDSLPQLKVYQKIKSFSTKKSTTFIYDNVSKK